MDGSWTGEATGALADTASRIANLSFFESIAHAWKLDPRAVWSSFTMIVVSEIGDKTFLIAAILAMRQSRLVVFGGAFSALAVMSILSALMGVVLPTLLPKSLTTFLAGVLFLVFGAKMLKDGWEMKGDEVMEEWEEAKREIDESSHSAPTTPSSDSHAVTVRLENLEEGRRKRSTELLPRYQNGRAHPLSNGGAANLAGSSSSSSTLHPPPKRNGPAGLRGNGNHRAHDSSSSSSSRRSSRQRPASLAEGLRNLCAFVFSPVFAQSFILTFLGEWGDRSQIATIALAAAHDVMLVSLGTIVGHALCTGVAVICGSWLARRISVKHVTLGGAALFLLFGVIFLYESLTERSAVASIRSLNEAAGLVSADGTDIPLPTTTTTGGSAGGGGALLDSTAAAAAAAMDSTAGSGGSGRGAAKDLSEAAAAAVAAAAGGGGIIGLPPVAPPAEGAAGGLGVGGGAGSGSGSGVGTASKNQAGGTVPAGAVHAGLKDSQSAQDEADRLVDLMAPKGQARVGGGGAGDAAPPSPPPPPPRPVAAGVAKGKETDHGDGSGKGGGGLAGGGAGEEQRQQQQQRLAKMRPPPPPPKDAQQRQRTAPKRPPPPAKAQPLTRRRPRAPPRAPAAPLARRRAAVVPARDPDV